MNCFNHKDIVAIGICKSCNKGICIDCAVDVDKGLACKNSCEEEVIELNEQIERGKKIYGIGEYKSKIPSTGVIMWFIFTLTAWGIAINSYLQKGYTPNSTLVLAIIFSVIFGLVLYSSKRTGLKC